MLAVHQKQWGFLRKSLKNQKIPHAYLFSGPNQIGKMKVALEFVKLISCQENQAEEGVCNVCFSCQAFTKNTHPDFNLIELLPEKKEIKIDQIRNDLIAKLSLRPSLSFYKIGIINQADLMSGEAQNCLLKILEEPKGQTLLILITEHAESLFTTIRSRLQEIRFYPVSNDLLEDFLLRNGADKNKAEKIASLCLGKPEKALDFLKNPAKLEKEIGQVQEFIKILRSDIGKRFKYAHALSEKPLNRILSTWLIYLRQALLAKTVDLPKTNIPDLDSYSLPQIKKIIEQLQNIIFLSSTRNINKRLALEILMMELSF